MKNTLASMTSASRRLWTEGTVMKMFLAVFEVLVVILAVIITVWAFCSHRAPRGILEWLIMAAVIVLIEWVKGG